MPIELRILSGARAGQAQSFDKPVIAVGRHPLSDLRFDAKLDLDVSTKHGEIRSTEGRYIFYDHQSTNGTFVNGVRVPPGGSRLLQTGDTVTFGAQGPAMAVVIPGQPAAGASAYSPHPSPPTPPPPQAPQQPPSASRQPARAPNAPSAPKAPGASPSAPPATVAATVAAPRPRNTNERVAIAVKERTRSLQMMVISAVVVAAAIAGGALWFGHRETSAAEADVRRLLASNDSMSQQYQSRIGRLNDSSLSKSLQRLHDSIVSVAKAAQAAGGGSVAAATVHKVLTDEDAFQRKVSEMDLPAVHDANDRAIVFINAEMGSTAQEATGFAVNSTGLIVTNHHVVEDKNGTRATKIHVKFANSRSWQPAHTVKVADDPQVDLALIQLDQPGHTPTVAGIATDVDIPVGSPIVTIGFPKGTSLPMDGTGNDLAAKTTMTFGIVSKSIEGVLQLDAFATHGSSGSPVFDVHKHVVGVVWGGEAEKAIVLAVPAARVVELIKSAK